MIDRTVDQLKAAFKEEKMTDQQIANLVLVGVVLVGSLCTDIKRMADAVEKASNGE